MYFDSEKPKSENDPIKDKPIPLPEKNEIDRDFSENVSKGSKDKKDQK